MPVQSNLSVARTRTTLLCVVCFRDKPTSRREPRRRKEPFMLFVVTDETKAAALQRFIPDYDRRPLYEMF